MGNCFPAGIDIGSTTVKLVILDTNGQILFGQYRRHRAHTQETLAQLLREARQQLGPCSLRVGITGSGSMNLGKAMGPHASGATLNSFIVSSAPFWAKKGCSSTWSTMGAILALRHRSASRSG